MTGARGQRVPDALVLAARLAASRFASRWRTVVGGRPAWVPIVLRWARRRVKRGEARSRPQSIAVIAGWRPQVLLHFDVRVLDRAAPRSLPGRLAAAAIDQVRRIVVERLRTSTRSVASGPDPHRDRAITHPLRGATAEIAGQHAFASPEGRRPSPAIAVPIATHVAPHPWRPLVRRFGSAVGQRASAEGGVPASGAGRWPRPRDVDVAREWPLARRIAPSTAVRDAASPVSQSHRSLELVWRAALGPVASARSEGARSETFAPSLRPARSFAAEQTAAAPARSAGTPAGPSASIDPRMLDRLTDDVIRRVERRIRIERERRGL